MKTKIYKIIFRSYALTLFLSYSLTVFNTYAQTENNFVLDSATIQKNELKITPEIEEIVLIDFNRTFKNLSDEQFFYFGLTNKSQLENLRLGTPFPHYMFAPFSRDLIFSSTWYILVLSKDEPISLICVYRGVDGQYSIVTWGNVELAKAIHDYEHKDLIIGFHHVNGCKHLIIRKDNKEISVQVQNHRTGEFFKNEYSFSELIKHEKELGTREALMRYYEKIANKTELILTPELTEMLISNEYSSLKNDSDESLLRWGIKDREQLENMHLGKPIPGYCIVDDKLTFEGYWKVSVMSDGYPLFFTSVKIENDGQYSWAGRISASSSEIFHNCEYKDRVIAYLNTRFSGVMDYLIIRKDNKDIFVEWYDWKAREYLKHEFTLSEIINLSKK